MHIFQILLMACLFVPYIALASDSTKKTETQADRDLAFLNSTNSEPFCVFNASGFSKNGETVGVRKVGPELYFEQLGDGKPANAKLLRAYTYTEHAVNINGRRGTESYRINTCLGFVTFYKDANGCKPPKLEVQGGQVAAERAPRCDFSHDTPVGQYIFQIEKKGDGTWEYLNKHDIEGRPMTEKSKTSSPDQDFTVCRKDLNPLTVHFHYDANTTDENKKCRVELQWNPVGTSGTRAEESHH